MQTAISDDMFSPEVIADPYPYYDRLREEDPVHWNEKYQTWIISRIDDLTWMTRHHELFSSAVFRDDPRAPYPEIDESDMGIYDDIVRLYQANQFIQHDRPEHLEMRKVVHSYFTPKSMEEWRPFIKNAITHLLDQVQDKGHMDIMRDLATPLPVLVIAEMMGVPPQDRVTSANWRKNCSTSARRTRPDDALSEGMIGMQEYVSPLVDERLVNPGNDFISVLAGGEKAGIFNRQQVLVNTSLLLLAGHETTINLLCNGTLAFIQHPDQWERLKSDKGETLPPLINRATEECLRYDAPVKSIQRIASEMWRCAAS